MLLYIANDHNPYHDQLLHDQLLQLIVICLIETSCETSPHIVIMLTSHKLFRVFYIRTLSVYISVKLIKKYHNYASPHC